MPSDGMPSDGMPSNDRPSDDRPSDDMPSDDMPSDDMPSDSNLLGPIIVIALWERESGMALVSDLYDSYKTP
jgi:hypothetical protein